MSVKISWHAPLPFYLKCQCSCNLKKNVKLWHCSETTQLAAGLQGKRKPDHSRKTEERHTSEDQGSEQGAAQQTRRSAANEEQREER